MTQRSPTSDPTDPFCADMSRQAGEQLFGSATRVDTWLLLEYGGEWRSKATQDNDLPPDVQDWLAAALKTLPFANVQFIGKPGGRTADSIAFYVALAREADARLFRFDLESYDDLLALDMPGVMADPDAYSKHQEDEPLLLVCANGKRDRCCALRGTRAYGQLAEFAGDRLWQTTHLGGHRFAANGVWLPHGVLYGHLDDADPAALIGEIQAGRITLAHYRGRACYEPGAQVAEYFLRQRSGKTALADFSLLEVEAMSNEDWTARFRSPDGDTHRLTIHSEVFQSLILSCGAAEAQPVRRYALADYAVNPVSA